MHADNPVTSELFELGAAGVSLIGSQCDGCGAYYFPQALSCRNPRCDDKRVKRVHLAQRGTLVSYTIQRYRPPPLFRKDEWAPYAIGLIDLGEGLEVMGILDVPAFDQISIRMPLRVTTVRLFTDEVRGPVQTYAFSREEARE